MNVRIVSLVLLCANFYTLCGMAVAVPKQQAVKQVQYYQTQSVLQKQQAFHQNLINCLYAFKQALKDHQPAHVAGPAFIDSFQTHDISLMLLMILITQTNDSLMYTKACLDTLYYNGHEYPAYAQTLPLLVQSFCDADGKLSTQQNKIRPAIYNAFRDAMPEKFQNILHKIWDFAPDISVLKKPEWHTLWNNVLLHMHGTLVQEPKQASCTLQQARENQYNKDLYTLFALGKNQDFEKATQLAKQYHDDPLFKRVFTCYFAQSPQCKELNEKTSKPEITVAPSEKRAEQRNNAEQATKHTTKPYTKEYPLTPQTQHYLYQAYVKPQPFQTCHGTPTQQQAHKEITKINKKAAELDKKNNNNPHIKKITREIPRLTNVAREYNEHGFTERAFAVLDFCWSLLDATFSVARGIGNGVILGIGSQVEYFIEHPIEFLARPLIGNFICALRLAQLTAQLVDISFIGLKSLVGIQEAKDQWETIRHNMSLIKNKLLAKFNTMTLEEYAQETTILATRFMLDYKCAQVLAGIYEGGLNDFMEHNAMRSPHLLSANAAGASTILAGDGTSLLEHVIYYSGNGVSASMETTLHEHIQNLVPSSETIYRIARNEHMPPFSATRAEIIAQSQKGPAQFIAHGLVSILKDAWHNGIESCDDGQIWHIMRCENAIGAIDGRTTKFLKVKKVGNVLHGQPITFTEFLILKNGFYNV